MNKSLTTIPFLLIINGILGNQTGYQEAITFGIFAYYLATIIGFLYIIKYSSLNIFILAPIFFIVSRIISVLYYNGNVYLSSINLLTGFIFYATVGALFAMNYLSLLNKQVKIFFILSLPIIIIQFLGISEFFHEWNSLFVKIDNFGEVQRDNFFVLEHFLLSRDALYDTYGIIYTENFAWQVRPPGLTHSSQVLSVWILFGWSFNLSYRKFSKIGLYDIFLIIITILSGSKIALFGSLILIVIAIFLGIKLSKRIFYYYLFFLLLEFIFFPAAFMTNYSQSALEVSFLFRLVDAALYFFPENFLDFEFIGDIYKLYPTIFNNENYQPGSFSGIVSLFKILPIIFVGIFFVWPLYVKILRWIRDTNKSCYYLSILILFSCLMAPFSGFFFSSQLYAFFCGIALLPLYLVFSKYRWDIKRS